MTALGYGPDGSGVGGRRPPTPRTGSLGYGSIGAGGGGTAVTPQPYRATPTRAPRQDRRGRAARRRRGRASRPTGAARRRATPPPRRGTDRSGPAPARPTRPAPAGCRPSGRP